MPLSHWFGFQRSTQVWMQFQWLEKKYRQQRHLTLSQRRMHSKQRADFGGVLVYDCIACRPVTYDDSMEADLWWTLQRLLSKSDILISRIDCAACASLSASSAPFVLLWRNIPPKLQTCVCVCALYSIFFNLYTVALILTILELQKMCRGRKVGFKLLKGATVSGHRCTNF